MTKYRVTLSEVASYTIIVDAENEDAAYDQAEQIMGDKGVAVFECEVHSRADNVELVP